MGQICSSCTTRIEGDSLNILKQYGADRRIVSLSVRSEEVAHHLLTRSLLTSNQPSIYFIFGYDPSPGLVQSYARWILKNAFDNGFVWGLVEDSGLKGLLCYRKPSLNQNFSTDFTIRSKRPNIFRVAQRMEDVSGIQERFNAIHEEIDKIYDTNMEKLKQHWVLDFVGVDPDYQDQGAGDAMVNALLMMSNLAPLPVYLTCSGDSLADWFSRKGFRIECSFYVTYEPEGGSGRKESAKMHAMIRWPKGSSKTIIKEMPWCANSEYR